MKSSLLTGLLIAILPIYAFSQTRLTKTYPVQNGQNIDFKFDYPKVIHISSWDKKEIEINASININNGANDSAFTLNETTVDGKIAISNKIDLDKIPDSYYIMANGIKTKFTSKQDMENYKKDKAGINGISYYQQKDIVVTIEIKVPANISTSIVSVYGMVELDNFNGPLKVDATYGGIDASVNTRKIGEIKLTNRFGKIYSNLDLKPTKQTEQNFYTSITASPGTGPAYDINSSYGNIYLRKSLR